MTPRRLWEMTRGFRGAIALILLVLLAWGDGSRWHTCFGYAPWYVSNGWDGVCFGRDYFKKDQPAFYRTRLDWGWRWAEPGFYWEQNGQPGNWDVCVPHWLILVVTAGGGWGWRREYRRSQQCREDPATSCNP